MLNLSMNKVKKYLISNDIIINTIRVILLINTLLIKQISYILTPLK